MGRASSQTARGRLLMARSSYGERASRREPRGGRRGRLGDLLLDLCLSGELRGYMLSASTKQAADTRRRRMENASIRLPVVSSKATASVPLPTAAARFRACAPAVGDGHPATRSARRRRTLHMGPNPGRRAAPRDQVVDGGHVRARWQARAKRIALGERLERPRSVVRMIGALGAIRVVDVAARAGEPALRPSAAARRPLGDRRHRRQAIRLEVQDQSDTRRA